MLYAVLQPAGLPYYETRISYLYFESKHRKRTSRSPFLLLYAGEATYTQLHQTSSKLIPSTCNLSVLQ